MAQQHDLFDDIIDISKGLGALKDPFGGITDTLMRTFKTLRLLFALVPRAKNSRLKAFFHSVKFFLYCQTISTS